MFDAIGVSQRTRTPWTVAVSFAGQGVMIGLAVLVPLVATEALPHGRFAGFLVPEPPRPPAGHKPPADAAKHFKPIPFQEKAGVLVQPAHIPEQPASIVDPDSLPPAPGSDIGVPFGVGDQNGGGNAVIESIARAAPRPAPPAPTVAKEPAPRPVPRIVVGGNVQAGKLISGPRPEYPPLARAARVSGSVKLRAIIARDGTIMDLRVVSGPALLVRAALSAVAQWVFQPTFLNGDPVEVATEIEVNFTLQR